MSLTTLVNPATLAELADMIGREKLDRLIERFAATLATSFANEGRNAADLGREAHALVAMAGMLGCDALFQACRDLETAARSGTRLAEALQAARGRRDETLVELRTRP